LYGSTTIKDIARVAQVAPSTVSRALRTDPRISGETTALILRLAQEMGYTPSLAARDLVTQKTNTIGLVISSVSDLFVADVVIGVEQAARSHGYSVFLISSYRDARREEQAVRSLHERRTDGIIVTGSQIDEGYLALRGRAAQPVVLINCPSFPHSISTDSLAGACEAVSHLVRLGHRRIAYIANPGSYQANLARAEGYKATLACHELALDDDLIVAEDGTLCGGKAAAQRLLAVPQPPTALFCFNDMMAIGAMCALHEAGRQVPADCSVIGFDDLELAAYCCPPLTTVRQSGGQLGQHAVNMLYALIQGRGDVKPEILPATLVVRETTGPAPAAAGSGKGVIQA
jgi:DNA-binding LacI/PurR family transcriptional regulator